MQTPRILAFSLALLTACGPASLTVGDAQTDDALRLAAAPCSELTVLRGRIGSGQSASALAVADQSGGDDDWLRYVEFSAGAQATCRMKLPTTARPPSLSLRVSYRGPQSDFDLWTFEVLDVQRNTWVKVADNGFAADWDWSRTSVRLPGPVDRFLDHGTVLMRYSSTTARDASLLDQWVLVPGKAPDAGSVAQDAGAPPYDAGTASLDAGTVDAGATRDAGATVDAGAPRDAGVAVDAGAPVDAGTPAGNALVVAPSGAAYSSIQAALNVAMPGDTVLVRAGVYGENVSFPRSGSATGGFITLQGEPGAILDGTGKGEVGVAISGRSFVKVLGMTIRSYRGSGTPMGISVNGASQYVELRNNLVHTIENANGNAHGIAVYGDSATPISHLVVDGNEVRNCKLGQSESLVLNGNVSGFEVSHNLVHDNDNIGIDFIGFEGVGPAGQDQARNGVCTDNVVFNISSAANPTYRGERSADGIYVDGGRDIVIERNKVDATDIGIEVASEHGGKTTSNIVIRNNFVSRSFQGNVMVGGYASNRGNAQNISVVHNTLYQGSDGAVVLQFNCSALTIRNNIFVGADYVVAAGSNNTGIAVDNNLYFGGSSSSPGAFPDPHARFANPQLKGAPQDLHVAATSPAIDAGLALGNDAQGQPLSGALDADGQPRQAGNAVDLGADETP